MTVSGTAAICTNSSLVSSCFSCCGVVCWCCFSHFSLPNWTFQPRNLHHLALLGTKAIIEGTIHPTFTYQMNLPNNKHWKQSIKRHWVPLNTSPSHFLLVHRFTILLPLLPTVFPSLSTTYIPNISLLLYLSFLPLPFFPFLTFLSYSLWEYIF